METLKVRLKAGETCVGTFISCNAPDLVEIAGLTGFDFVVIDNEHGPLTHESSQQLLRAAELRGIAPVVRIPDYSETAVLHALDIGAHGIQVPQVNSMLAAHELVARAKYPPRGMRGAAFPRAANYGVGINDVGEYFRQANSRTMIVAHCESAESLANIDEICSVPGIDVVFLGPYDMSASMGIPGQVGHEKIANAAQAVVQAAERSGIAAGIFCIDGAHAAQMARQGFRYITIGMDTTLYASKCLQELESFRRTQ